MQNRQGNDELRQWERDWRATIQGQVSDTAKSLSDVAGVIHEMQSDVKELMLWKANIEQRKDAKLDNQPDVARNFVGTYGGCMGQALFAVISFVSLAIAIAGLVITLTR